MFEVAGIEGFKGYVRLVRALDRRGILVRGRHDFPREGFVRISAGTRAQAACTEPFG